jgi:hypothetical protein
MLTAAKEFTKSSACPEMSSDSEGRAKNSYVVEPSNWDYDREVRIHN